MIPVRKTCGDLAVSADALYNGDQDGDDRRPPIRSHPSSFPSEGKRNVLPSETLGLPVAPSELIGGAEHQRLIEELYR